MKNHQEIASVNPTDLVKLKKRHKRNMLLAVLIGMVFGSFLAQDMDSLKQAFKKGYEAGNKSEKEQTEVIK
ncbi:hypothetical protein [Sphingobacterium sp. MYb382]|uniref:hypothetical protein n=1 Tax=Sphingobacterium sp. MYb382 TaxID=2745278 RepID=UPI003094E8C1